MGRAPTNLLVWDNTSSKIKYNLHQMNKEIIHQRHKLTQKNLYTTIERSRRSNVYTYWAYCSVRLQKALQMAENILKPEYFGIKNNSLNQLQSL
jgi:hypothetical protein